MSEYDGFKDKRLWTIKRCKKKRGRRIEKEEEHGISNGSEMNGLETVKQLSDIKNLVKSIDYLVVNLMVKMNLIIFLDTIERWKQEIKIVELGETNRVIAIRK